MTGHRSLSVQRPRSAVLCRTNSPVIQRHSSSRQNVFTEPAASPRTPTVTELLRQSAAEHARPIGEPLRSRLGQHFGQDFSRVRVHAGPASAVAAERIGARAFTLGSDIHLGAQRPNPATAEFHRLMAHEAVHTVQQGGHSIPPHAGLTVSHPADPAEMEAEQLSRGVTAPENSTRPRLPGPHPGPLIARSVTPLIQRDLTKPLTVPNGTFTPSLKTESHAGAKSGISGTIKFKASATAPDSDTIRILQIARVEDLTTGKDFTWTGGEANRSKVMTAAAKDVDPGFFVDVVHAGNPPHTAKRNPRTSKTDAPVSPYYIDDYGTGGGNQDGSKKGKTIVDASIYDYPGWSVNSRFSLETAAKSTKGASAGSVYATLSWGFTISDASKGKVEKEHMAANPAPTATFGAAVKKFDEFYKNPGASTAP